MLSEVSVFMSADVGSDQDRRAPQHLWFSLAFRTVGYECVREKFVGCRNVESERKREISQ